ncbi:MAG: 6-pyruvoyl-tetrahydropterin synthase-related protein [Chloroflexi bacterium]|nr:6-pyruvoyl-tetrahydropterin synthase-related protein [Chloroflexota bacterium]MCL5025114.1 6-pyruvoyl-tetrahydropterin synthase-related protein [Chloroflexota bacterium]
MVVLAAFGLVPLTQSLFFSSSDGQFHLFRLVEYDSVMRQGVLVPRWAPDFFLGLGYPLPNYYAPLTYYLGVAVHLLGFPFLDTMRVLAALGMVLSGWGAYLYARRLLSSPTSLLVAAAYMFAPYHLVNLYFRGDFPEYLAFVWYPLILYGVGEIWERPRPPVVLLAAASFAGLMLTHNLSAFLFAPLLVLYVMALTLTSLLDRNYRGTLAGCCRIGGTLALGAALSAFFWVPAMWEQADISMGRLLQAMNYRNHFPAPTDLLSTDPLHRYGIVFRGAEVFGYRLGLLQAVFLALGLVATVLAWRGLRRDLRRDALYSLLVAAIALFLIFPVSASVWEALPLLSLTQFPWRFLAYLALPSAFLAGLVVEAIAPRLRQPLAFGLALAFVASAVLAMRPMMTAWLEEEMVVPTAMEFELTDGALGTSVAAEYLPRQSTNPPTISTYALATVTGMPESAFGPRKQGDTDVQLLERGAESRTYAVKAATGQQVTFDLLCFSGWRAWLDGEPVTVSSSPSQGLCTVAVPSGDHQVRFALERTAARRAAEMLSLAAVVPVLLLLAITLNTAVRRHRRPWTLKIPRRTLAANMALLALVATGWWLFKVSFDQSYSSLGYGHPLQVDFGPVTVVGYDLGGPQVLPGPRPRAAPGDVVTARMYWTARNADAARTEYRPFAALINAANQVWAYGEGEADIAGEVPGQGPILDSPMRLAIATGTPPGVYRLEMGFLDREGHRLEPRRSYVVRLMPMDNRILVGPVVITEAGQSPAGASAKALANFDNVLGLLEARVTDGESALTGRPGQELPRSADGKALRAEAGQIVHLDLLWRSMAERLPDVVVALRLVDDSGFLWAVRDSRSADGRYPSSLWKQNELVKDQLDILVRPETPPGEYTLRLELVSARGPLNTLDAQGKGTNPFLDLGRVSVVRPAGPPRPGRDTPRRSVDLALADGLKVVGYQVGPAEAKPGTPVQLDIFWQTGAGALPDYRFRAELRDSSGKAWAAYQGRPVGDGYPTSRWHAGEVLRGQYHLPVSPRAPAGPLDLYVWMDQPQVTEPVLFRLDQIRVPEVQRTYSATPSFERSTDLGSVMRLLGYGLDVQPGGQVAPDGSASVPPGTRLDLKLYWKALGETDTSYKVFAQVLDGQGRVVAQHDSFPAGGARLTTSLVSGEVIEDLHTIALPANLAPGRYTLIIGLYEPISGGRLSQADGTNFVSLSGIEVRQP